MRGLPWPKLPVRYRCATEGLPRGYRTQAALPGANQRLPTVGPPAGARRDKKHVCFLLNALSLLKKVVLAARRRGWIDRRVATAFLVAQIFSSRYLGQQWGMGHATRGGHNGRCDMWGRTPNCPGWLDQRRSRTAATTTATADAAAEGGASVGSSADDAAGRRTASRRWHDAHGVRPMAGVSRLVRRRKWVKNHTEGLPRSYRGATEGLPNARSVTGAHGKPLN
jgi:hypothetical protein